MIDRIFREDVQPEVRQEPIFGWRAYNFDKNISRLRGLRGTIWDSKELEALCYWPFHQGYSKDYLRKKCLDHLSINRCHEIPMCGIYGASLLSQLEWRIHLVIAYCVAWGVVTVDSSGNWRASDVAIEKLYIASENRLLLDSNFSISPEYLMHVYKVPAEIKSMRELLSLEVKELHGNSIVT